MAYSNAYMFSTDSPIQLSVGTKLAIPILRRARVVGWGLQCVVSPVGLTTQAQLRLWLNNVNKDTVTMAASKQTSGAILERSEIIRNPTAPDAVFTGFVADAGSLVTLEVATAEAVGTGGTPGTYVPFVLIEPLASGT